MKKYSKPTIFVNDEDSEGVYAASGCYSITVNIHQKPQNGRGDYRIQVNGIHKRCTDDDNFVQYAGSV